MRKVSIDRKAFIEITLLKKTWSTSKIKGEGKLKTFRLSEVEQIMKDIQTGKAFLATVNGSYILDGGTAYGYYEYKI